MIQVKQVFTAAASVSSRIASVVPQERIQAKHVNKQEPSGVMRVMMSSSLTMLMNQVPSNAQSAKPGCRRMEGVTTLLANANMNFATCVELPIDLLENASVQW